MNVHFLPGIDPKTEEWAQTLLRELGFLGDTATVQRYLHYEGVDIPVQRDEEIKRLAGRSIDLLFGKSLGVGLGLRACIEGVISPEKAVFIGLPLTSLMKQGLDVRAMVEKAQIPALFIQQVDDPLGGAASLREALPTAKIIEVAGNDHQYSDVKELATHIQGWLGI